MTLSQEQKQAIARKAAQSWQLFFYNLRKKRFKIAFGQLRQDMREAKKIE